MLRRYVIKLLSCPCLPLCPGSSNTLKSLGKEKKHAEQPSSLSRDPPFKLVWNDETFNKRDLERLSSR